jgi:phosphoribosylaminoimidazole-succinocarboxamide synthase
MADALLQTHFALPGQQSLYHGKVRDVYSLEDGRLVMVATDRISAFDVVLPEGIPHKGQVLNQIACHFLEATKDIIPNWLLACPDPQVTVGLACEPFKVEMVVRGYLAGHAAREYHEGKRKICGVELPDGLVENQKLRSPIITPTTKASEGHDMDISREEIISSGLVSEVDYSKLEAYSLVLFQRGTEMAAERDLILVDTKYEFGKKDGEIYLIDEIHTPDSSRFFYKSSYLDRFEKGQPQHQLSKEFVRKWLMEHGFEGKDGQEIPFMSEEWVLEISDRYIELFEKITGEKFRPAQLGDKASIEQRIEENLFNYLKA